VDSEPGSGTVFHINLDLGLPKQTEADRTMAAAAPDPSMNSDIRVLAVDDHPINLEILEGMLEPEGFQFSGVQDAKEAFALLELAEKQEKPYSIVLLDYQMPDMDGRDFVTRVRADDRFDPIQIIMLTSIDQAISATDRKRLNIHASITKPLRRSRLFDAINQTLGRSENSVSPVAATPVSDLAAEEIAEARSQKPQLAADALLSELDQISGFSRPEENSKTRPLNILVVEDNLVNQMVIDELLQEFGHSTVLAENGEQAIECVKKGGIDLILMDCQMPVMDGFEATRRIRAREEERDLPHMPIIAVTSNAIKGDRERCLRAGMDDYVSKPINTAKLVAAIESHTGDDALIRLGV